MKKAYVKPSMESETFVPQTYVAACGDEHKVYEFKCDATGGVLGMVYQETNGEDGLQIKLWGGDTMLTPFGYHACGIIHYAPVTDDFVDGYYMTSTDGIDATPVKIWKGENGDNIHCTTNVHMETWVTHKS